MDASVSTCEEVRFAVGSAVMVRESLYEAADDCHPGGYLAMRGDKLIVRQVRSAGFFPIHVSHEGRTDGLTFGVTESEIEPWKPDSHATAPTPTTGEPT